VSACAARGKVVDELGPDLAEAAKLRDVSRSSHRSTGRRSPAARTTRRGPSGPERRVTPPGRRPVSTAAPGGGLHVGVDERLDDRAADERPRFAAEEVCAAGLAATIRSRASDPEHPIGSESRKRVHVRLGGRGVCGEPVGTLAGRPGGPRQRRPSRLAPMPRRRRVARAGHAPPGPPRKARRAGPMTRRIHSTPRASHSAGTTAGHSPWPAPLSPGRSSGRTRDGHGFVSAANVEGV
jgi:hypothetical protein